jgi:hypothetical protein
MPRMSAPIEPTGSEPGVRPAPPATPAPPDRRWLWPATLVVLALVGLAGTWLVLDRMERAARTVAEAPARALDAADRALRGFLRGDVTERFLSSIPTVTSPAAGNLEVAIAENVETLSRTDERFAFWDLVPLGRTTVEVRVPVTWRYHLSLSDPWRVEVEGDVCRVLAPRLRPSLPPAIDTARLERRVESDWTRSDGPARLVELERMLTEALSRRAGDRLHLALVREPARRSVEGFVRRWLLDQRAWGAGGVERVEVRFADEPPRAGDEPPAPPTSDL